MAVANTRTEFRSPRVTMNTTDVKRRTMPKRCSRSASSPAAILSLEVSREQHEGNDDAAEEYVPGDDLEEPEVARAWRGAVGESRRAMNVSALVSVATMESMSARRRDRVARDEVVGRVACCARSTSRAR